MKSDEYNHDINVLQVDPNELKRHYRSSTKFQVGDLQIGPEPLKQNHFHSIFYSVCISLYVKMGAKICTSQSK